MTSRDMHQGSGTALRIYGAVVVCFLLLPIAVAAVMAFSGGQRLEFPPTSFSLRWFRSVLESSLLMGGLRISLIIALASTALASIAGTSAAIALNHYRFFGRPLIQAFLMLPVALPAIVLGLGMLFSLPLLGLRVVHDDSHALHPAGARAGAPRRRPLARPGRSPAPRPATRSARSSRAQVQCP